VLSLEAMMISAILSICGFVTSMTTSAALTLELRQTLFYQSSLSFVKSECDFRKRFSSKMSHFKFFRVVSGTKKT
jgi:hypothetical protein